MVSGIQSLAKGNFSWAVNCNAFLNYMENPEPNIVYFLIAWYNSDYKRYYYIIFFIKYANMAVYEPKSISDYTNINKSKGGGTLKYFSLN